MTIQPTPSNVECYWVLPGRFLAGEYPAHMQRPRSAARLDELLDAGVNAFLDLTSHGELAAYLPLVEQRAERRQLQIHYRRFPIADLGVPTRAEMLQILDFIDLALESGDRIYLHCWGGVGRTGLVVACWLVRHGQSPSEALQQIATWRQTLLGAAESPQSPETSEQIGFVQAWSELVDKRTQ